MEGSSLPLVWAGASQDQQGSVWMFLPRAPRADPLVGVLGKGNLFLLRFFPLNPLNECKWDGVERQEGKVGSVKSGCGAHEGSERGERCAPAWLLRFYQGHERRIWPSYLFIFLA